MPKQAVQHHTPFAPTHRDQVEAAIEAHLDTATALMALLDQLDGDPDSEPSLAGLECIGSFEGHCAGGPAFDQSRWSTGDRNDLEDEHDGRESENWA